MTASRGRPGAKIGDKTSRGNTRGVTVQPPGDGQPKAWAIPDGDWTPEARRWWDAAISSVAAEVAWHDDDRPKMERLLWMIDAWWRATVEDPTAAWRNASEVRHHEAELYLSPLERARAGLARLERVDGRVAGPKSRARLRVAGGADAVCGADAVG